MKKIISIEKTEDMIYYHYTNLIHANSIMNDFEIKTSGAEQLYSYIVENRTQKEIAARNYDALISADLQFKKRLSICFS